MENLYYFVTTLTTWEHYDPRGFLNNYFIENGAFVTCFLIALAVAVVGLLLFYGWIGMSSSKLSKLSTWIVTFVCVGLITMAATQLVVIGSDASNSGFFGNATEYAQTKLRPAAIKISPEEGQKFEREFNDIRGKMDKGCDVVYVLDTWNMGISLIIFFVGSLGVKRLTRYAISVPF